MFRLFIEKDNQKEEKERQKEYIYIYINIFLWILNFKIGMKTCTYLIIFDYKMMMSRRLKCFQFTQPAGVVEYINWISAEG